MSVGMGNRLVPFQWLFQVVVDRRKGVNTQLSGFYYNNGTTISIY